MNVTTTPAPALTDLGGADAPAARITPDEVRRLALPLAAGAAVWSAASYVWGFTPTTELGWKVTDLAGLAFQAGVMSLVTLQLRTRATGTSRAAATMLRVERVLLAVAMLWSLLHALVPAARGTVWLGVLDAFWPLSMLGMFVIGVKVALAGRWRGSARFWPLVAESWAVTSIPVMGIFGQTVGTYFGATHLLVGYATLGLILAARPHLVTDR